MAKAPKKAKAKRSRKASPTPVTAVPPDEKKWRAESDARTLAEAAAIKNDPTRLKSAKGAAKRMVAETQRRALDATAEACAMASLAGKDK